MARALLLALTCAAAASATSYVDYAGVKMPQYGSGADYELGRDPPPAHTADDYHGHSPDAPASLDYKYEEELRIKTEKPSKDPEESDSWRKSIRKQKELIRPAKSDNNVRNKYDHDDEIPKFRTNRRYSKHRSRLKNENEETSPRRHNKYSRDRKDHVSDIDRKDYLRLDKDYTPDDKNNEFDDDVKFMREVTTKTSNRRRPREREFKSLDRDDDEYIEDALPEDIMRTETELEKDLPDTRNDIRKQRPPERRIVPERERIRSPFPTTEEEDEIRDDPSKIIPGKFKPKGYDEYEDYYDMKRVHNIKNKLPTLIRRTTVRMMVPTNSRSKMNTNRLEMLLTNRRMMPSPSSPHAAPVKTSTTSSSSSIIVTLTTLASTTTTASPTTGVASGELSLAEKSRLSILKKAQRKEGMSFLSTKKPPVLLQVTSQMPTVVMVEPPSSTAPWMRSKVLEEDSPARLELVKKLMRHKLVAEARSFNDLTDNWDDMVCDYIDTSLLVNAAVVLTPTMNISMFCLSLCVFAINL